jgi:hypothetical protein
MGKAAPLNHRGQGWQRVEHDHPRQAMSIPSLFLIAPTLDGVLVKIGEAEHHKPMTADELLTLAARALSAGVEALRRERMGLAALGNQRPHVGTDGPDSGITATAKVTAARRDGSVAVAVNE